MAPILWNSVDNREKGKNVHLLNRAAVKKCILETIKSRRPFLSEKITRISKEALDEYEAKFRLMIQRDVDGHPTTGKTFRP